MLRLRSIASHSQNYFKEIIILSFSMVYVSASRSTRRTSCLELDPVGGEKEHGVVVVIIFVGRIDDAHALAFEKGLQGVDIPAVAQLEGIVMQAEVADAVCLAALGRRDPVARLAVGPADRVGILVRDLEAQELEQPAVEGLGLLIVADPDRDVIDTDHLA